MLVTLRLFIGWQFFYEGMWKYQTMGTANEWTAEGYLKNAQGPFRSVFRGMLGDPDGLDWLNYDKVVSKWDRFENKFASYYGLSDSQRAQLNELINGSERITRPLSALPKGVVWPKAPEQRTGKELAKVVTWDGKQLIARASEPPKPSEIAWALSLVPIEKKANGEFVYTGEDGTTSINRDVRKLDAPKDVIEYYKSVSDLEVLVSRKLGYKNRARASLIGDPDRKGVTAVLRDDKRYAPAMETTKSKNESVDADSIVYGEIQVYKDLLDELESYYKGDKITFREDHAKKIQQKVTEKYNEIVVPIVNLDADLRDQAMQMLTPEQFAKGALPPENTPLRVQSQRAMWGLLILGALLILGLATRFAALAGAVMLTSFYIVWPPWPGVPAAPGPEHAFVVNKNLIEVVALLAIAAMPTGTWFGVDGIIYRLFNRSKSKQAVA